MSKKIELSSDEMPLKIKELTREIRRLQTRATRLDVANIALRQENNVLKKSIEKRANEKYLEILGRIMQRAEGTTIKPHMEPGGD